ncbi:class I SAM-dependent methyltransferase [Fodinicola feengrottensis]|uniref:Methyltransferase type 11 domain-containing protein n=1 Tax=Fodinicola feengrottensis TaxID=435914 RepID=A0ABP4US92_9ACTN|nr:class I SAM-dependent methyltransferase [Fodinicola feengrottensis]
MADDVENLLRMADVHWWARGRRRLIAQHAGKIRGRYHCDGHAQPVALDVGAGVGQITDVLRDGGWKALAVELDAEGASAIGRRGHSAFRGDATRLPLADESVDLVVSSDVLEHIPDHVSAAAELLRVLRRGGFALVAVPAHPALWSAHDVAINHQRRYRRSELIDLMRDAGFALDDSQVWSWNILLYPAVRTVRAMGRRRLEAAADASPDSESDPKSDLAPVHPIVNWILTIVLRIESVLPHWLAVRLPGVSLVVLARRPA